MKMPVPKKLIVKNIETPTRRKPTHSGPLGKAKLLTKEQFERAADEAMKTSMFPLRDRMFVYLSRFGGLRAQEIARIHVEDFTDAEGRVIPELHISKRGAKYGKARTIDIPEVLVTALKEYKEAAGIDNGPLFYTARGDKATSNVVQLALRSIYDRCGFKGARSHSGRRYAITTLAQHINLDGGSLEDVRIFAGHSDLKTTAGYIEKSAHGKKMALRL